MTWHKLQRLRVAPESVRRLRAKLKVAFRMGRGRNMQRFIESLRPLLIGWGNYFRLAEVKRVFEDLDGWLRRRLIIIFLRQLQSIYTWDRIMVMLGLGVMRVGRM